MSPELEYLDDLMSRQFEGLLTETEEEELAAHLASSDEARAIMAQLMRLEGRIAHLGEARLLSTDDAASGETRPRARPVANKRSPLRRAATFAPVVVFAAAALAAGIVLLVRAPGAHEGGSRSGDDALVHPTPDPGPSAAPESQHTVAHRPEDHAPARGGDPLPPPSSATAEPVAASSLPEKPHDAGRAPERAPATHARESRTVGYIDSVEGDVEFAHGSEGAWSPVAAGAPFLSGDRLRTKFSRANVAFESGSVMHLNRFTTLGLQLAERTQLPLVSLTGGEIYVETSVDDAGFSVETPHGAVVDHGTRFVVEVKSNRTLIAVAEGRVEASTDAGNVNVAENQEVLLVRRKSPPGTVRSTDDLVRRLAWARGRPDTNTAAKPLNLALGRPAIASSVHQEKFAVQRGNDDDVFTLWASDAVTRPQWWQVDLGVPCQIASVELVARQDDLPADQPAARRRFQVRASNREDFGRSVAIAAHSGAPFAMKGTWTARVRDGGFYRYVRVVFGGSHFHFAELRLFGRALRKR